MEKLPELVGESPEVVVVQHELLEIAQIPDLSRQRPQLVVAQVKPLEVVKE